MTAPAEPKTDDIDPDGLLGDEPQPSTEGAPAGEQPTDWKAKFDAQQKINRDLERRSKTKLRELETELASLKPKPGAEAKPPSDSAEQMRGIREQIQNEIRTETLRDKVLDKIEAKAARTFKDPEDALLRLGKNVDDYIVDGKIDVDAITEALGELLTQRPDFGITQGEPKRFQGTADGGPKGTAGKPQLTDADVKRLYKEGKTEEIEAARVSGQLNKLLGIT